MTRILQEASEVYFYARDTIKGRVPENECIIARCPAYAYKYAKYILRSRFPQAEMAISAEPCVSYYYARNVIKGRFIKAEPYIAQDRLWIEKYLILVVNNTHVNHHLQHKP